MDGPYAKKAISAIGGWQDNGGVKAVQFLVFGLLTSACAVSNHPQKLAQVPASTVSSSVSWQQILARPGPIELETVVSGRWEVELSGLLNLEHQKSQAAGIKDRKVPIVLPVHVLKHPQAGVFVVDSGVSQDMVEGGPGGTRGIVTGYIEEMKSLISLKTITEQNGGSLAGVLITHFHLDHILGLPDVNPQTPIYAGPGELENSTFINLFLRGTHDALLEGQKEVHTWDFAKSRKIGSIEHAIDVLGDGSLWALWVPGHTPGSTAYLANTTKGPVLFTGDCSHTFWGFEHGVEPGSFTEDHDTNQVSLQALKQIVQEVPNLRVEVGHQLRGDESEGHP